MKDIIRFVKRLFGKYEIGCEYWVRLDQIIIQEKFKMHPPKFMKMCKKWEWYREKGELQSPIILNNDFILVDGYTSYLIAKKAELGKVPVYFIE